MQLGDLADIPYVGLVTSQAEIKNNRESVRRTVAAVLDSLAWLRANRAESIKMIVDKFKVNQNEAENTYATLIRLLNKDGRLNPKVARGYLDILRQERPIPADFDSRNWSIFPFCRRALVHFRDRSNDQNWKTFLNWPVTLALFCRRRRGTKRTSKPPANKSSR